MQKEDIVPHPGINSDRSVFYIWDSSLSPETTRESLLENEPTQMKSRDRFLTVSNTWTFGLFGYVSQVNSYHKVAGVVFVT